MAAIIFDFDGTIADSFDYCVSFLAKEAGVKLTAQQKTSFHGHSLFRIARMLNIPWHKMPTLLHRGRKHMAPVLGDVSAFPGMPELIRDLHKKRHKLYIMSTNTERNVNKFLGRQELREYFVEVYGGVGMFGKAPALRRLLREQHIETRKAVYIGDELRDAEAAQSIGVKIISVTWGFARADDLKSRKPTGVAHSPEDIADMIDS